MIDWSTLAVDQWYCSSVSASLTQLFTIQEMLKTWIPQCPGLYLRDLPASLSCIFPISPDPWNPENPFQSEPLALGQGQRESSYFFQSQSTCSTHGL